ncbi:DUF1643 domain-containing protein [Zavarzinella formosa]|uniref:DUF1643 domain-containing protein n=1 Tax=Zavarzinella formosa TaxID=360055 RepID=UPI000307E114|nr:DUF1643 domain-containing protein [Zavarzinella formosa]
MTTPLLEQNAVISDCGKYRYALTRRVGTGVRTATFIMLNPSTADAQTDDPTIRRCIGFARMWNCGKLLVLNLFAIRATDPADMRAADDPAGPENKSWFDTLLCGEEDGPVVCAWGVHGTHMGQNLTVMRWLKSLGIQPVSLGVTKDGHPRHPLYVPYSAEAIPFLS